MTGARADCSACGRRFASVDLFDLHRRQIRGRGVCVDPRALGMLPADGVWRTGGHIKGASA